jgi:hypothetical protein
MLEEDRKRAGWSVGQAAWRLGVSIETWDRICRMFGWPETFVQHG